MDSFSFFHFFFRAGNKQSCLSEIPILQIAAWLFMNQLSYVFASALLYKVLYLTRHPSGILSYPSALMLKNRIC